MNNKELGYVYILTNPSFREDWVKIGKSSRPRSGCFSASTWGLCEIDGNTPY